MRKSSRLLAALLSLLLLSGCAEPAAPPEPTVPSLPTPTEVFQTEPLPEVYLPKNEAMRIFQDFTVCIGETDRTAGLTDGDVYSKRSITAHQTITVTSAEAFGSLYFIWDTVPGEYVIRWEGGSITCGDYGFLHDSVTLPQPQTRVEITFSSQQERTLCDLLGYTAGYAPEDVQVWQPPCQEADILVFPTHSDDDAIFFGALISYYAIQQQLKVQTAFLVDHWREPHRAHERLNGLWAMGVRHYPILGTAPDTATYDFYEAKYIYSSSNVLQWQVEQIRRFRPLVVVGHDLDGEYGNAGHKINAYYLTQAIHAARDPMQFPASAKAYGTWETPKLYLHLYRKHEIFLDVTTPMENDPQGRSPFEAAEDGFAAHVSQARWATVQYDGDPDYDCRRFGLYYTRVGFDTTPDIMENIVPAYWRNKK